MGRRAGRDKVTLSPGSFLFLRHGETDANARDIICGSTDLPLNETGLAQAQQAALHLQGLGLERIVTSPLMRARQTAQAAADLLQLPLTVVDGLAERNWGAWEGAPRETLRRDDTPPGGESPQAFATRTRAAFESITFDQPTLIVAHSGTDRVLHAAFATGPHRRLGNAKFRLWSPDVHKIEWSCHEGFKNER